jgi:hypothetical protein
VLALDHSRRPPWGPLHGVTVACYLLQHPGRAPADRDRPLALLRAYLDGGAAAAARFTEGARRANAHRGPGSPAPSRPQAAGKAPDGPRAAFAVTIADVAADGTFPADGFAERVTAWAEATAAAWRAPATHPR